MGQAWALREAHVAQLETSHKRLGQMLGLHHGPDDPSTAELLATTGQTTWQTCTDSMWLGHAANNASCLMPHGYADVTLQISLKNLSISFTSTY